LLQQGKGADAGATFGGSSNTVFGASGASTVLTKVTTGTAIAFILTALFLVKMYPEGVHTGGGKVVDVLTDSVMSTAVHPGEDTSKEDTAKEVTPEASAPVADSSVTDSKADSAPTQ